MISVPLTSQPWLAALQPPADSRRLLAPRSAWAILALASGNHRFAARIAAGLSAPEASRARARLKADGLIPLLPLVAARAGQAWYTLSDHDDLARCRSDARLAFTGGLSAGPAGLQAYVRAHDLPALVAEYGLQPGRDGADHSVLLRPVADPWPFPEAPAPVPDLVQALDLLEAALDGQVVDRSQAQAAWDLIERHAALEVPSWYRAARPPRAGPNPRSHAVHAAPPNGRGLGASSATDADTLAALLFAVGDPVRQADLLAATGRPAPRLQAAADALCAEPPRGLQILVDGDRLRLVTAPTASAAVERLLARLELGDPFASLQLPDTVWLVLGIIVLEQPITRAEITLRRLADSDRQVQVLLQHRLIREEPRAALPGRGIPLVTTDLLLRRFGVGSLGELQQRILNHPPEVLVAPA